MNKIKLYYCINNIPRRFSEAISNHVIELSKKYKNSKIITQNTIFGNKKRITLIFFIIKIKLFSLFSRDYKLYHVYSSDICRWINFLPLKKTIHSISSSTVGKYISKSIMDCYINVISKKLKYIITETPNIKNRLVGFGIDKSKIKVIIPGIDLNKYNCGLNTEKEIFRILFSSAPHSTKIQGFKSRGIVMLLKADTSTKVFKELVGAGATISFIHKRLKFGRASNCATFPSMLVFL